MELGHLDLLAPHGTRYGVEVDTGRDRGPTDVVGTAVQKGAELLGRRPEPGLLLLHDLRELHLRAAGASLDWVALGQGAQAARDTDLLDVVSTCHAETLRTLKWTTYRLKEAAPQVLMSP